MWIRADGPYGEVSIDYRRYPALLLACGGVGVTPIIGIIKDLYRIGDLSPEMRSLIRAHCIDTVWLLWSMPTFDVFGWFAEELTEALGKAGGPGMPNLRICLSITRAAQPSAEANELVNRFKDKPHASVQVKGGRPDVGGLLREVTKPRDGLSASDEAARAVTTFVCGPEGPHRFHARACALCLFYRPPTRTTATDCPRLCTISMDGVFSVAPLLPQRWSTTSGTHAHR
jgi:hypothetical protein